MGSLFITLLLIGCEKQPRELSLSGLTMGTTYNIKLIAKSEATLDESRLSGAIDSLLVEVNRQMSTYDSNSEISRFNRSYSDSLFPISTGFAEVVRQAIEISKITSRAFDITINPLIQLWGFSSWDNLDLPRPPSAVAIDSVLGIVGIDKIKIIDNHLQKLDPLVTIDLNAIAKGYGIDEVAGLLQQEGFTDYLVEIGGEVYCKGLNSQQHPWRIGIDTPRLDAIPGRELRGITEITDRGLATSGDYRNYFKFEGKLYSHVLDPRTGYPVETNVASATVIAPLCMQADALATALMVLGPDEGLDLIERLPDFEAMLILREGEDKFRTVKSAGMQVEEK